MELYTPETKSIKAAQLADHLRDLAASFVQRELPGRMITITAATVSPDFKRTSIYFRSFPVERTAIALQELEGLSAAFQRYLHGKLSRKAVPRAMFVIDDSAERDENIANLLNPEQI